MTPSPRQSSPAPLPAFDPAALQRLLDGDQAPIRRRVREILSRPSFRYLPPDASIDRQREAASGWCQELADEGIGALLLPAEYGGRGDYAAFTAAFETIAFHDISLTIKFTVQFGLWAGSILLLGSEAHHRRYLRDIGTFALPGCFALTEIGHGSNARELETTATYDPEGGEFVLHSPNFDAGKNYIGNAARDGRMAAVFAQLITRGANHGVHAFAVPIRDDQGNVLPGVRIEDNGPKMGENGVDNARLWFDGVRLPRAALLDRLGSVAADGTYTSPFANANARFFATISALVGGRIAIAAAAIGASKVGLCIAVRYARRRHQFRAPGASEETPLLDYPTHQRRLLVPLAELYAAHFAHAHLVHRRATVAAGTDDPAAAREVEGLAAGIKAWASWHCTRTLQACREACGGEGYLSVNRLPALKADSDIFTTFEGDNTVLMLWIGRLLAGAKRIDPGADPLPQDEPGRWEALLADRTRTMLDEAREQGPGALFRAAGAHLEAVLLARFNATLAAVTDPDLVESLAALRDLFALSRLEEGRGWFLEHGRMETGEARGLPGRVDALCARLAPLAPALVDAFGLPEASIAAPIALPP